MDKLEYSSYRWVVLAISWLCMFALSFGWYVMPTLQPQLMDLYNIETPEFNLALTVPFLIAGILSIPGGILADSWGIRKTVSLAMIIGGAGFLGRMFLGTFISLLVSMIGVGIGLGLMFPNIPKMVSAWFPPKDTAIASGIFTTGMFFGISTGMATASYLPEWLFSTSMMGISLLILSGIFFALARDTPPGVDLPPIKLVEGLTVSIKSRSVWATAIGAFVSYGGMVSFMSTLPLATNIEFGLTMAQGGLLASMITLFSVVGSLVVPLLTKKISRMKLMVILGIITALCIFVAWFLASLSIGILWVGVILVGVGGGGLPPLLLEVPVLLPSVKEDPVEQQHVGAAAALITSLMQVGGFVILPFLVTPVINFYSYMLGYTLSAICFGLISVFALLIKYPSQN